MLLAAATATAAMAALPAAAGGDAHAAFGIGEVCPHCPEVPPPAGGDVAEGMLVTAENLRIQVFHVNGVYPHSTRLAFAINGSSSLFGPTSQNYTKFASVHSVDVGPDGSIVAVDGRSAADYLRDGVDVTPIMVFHPNGTFNFRFGSPDQIGARVAVGPDGQIVTADTRSHRIEAHHNGTSYLTQLQPNGTYAACLLLESCATHHISVFRPNGTLDFSFGPSGSGPGQLYEPRGVDVGPDGRIVTVDLSATCYGLNASGARPFGMPCTWSRVQAFHPNGTLDRAFGPVGDDPGSLMGVGPRDVAVGPDGSIFVAYNSYPNDDIVVRLYPNGTRDDSFLFPRGSIGLSPFRMDVGPDGTIVVGNNYDGFKILVRFPDNVVLIKGTGWFGYLPGNVPYAEDVAIAPALSIAAPPPVQPSPPTPGNGTAPPPTPPSPPTPGNGTAPPPTPGNGTAPPPTPGNGTAPPPTPGNGTAPPPTPPSPPTPGNGTAPPPTPPSPPTPGNGTAPPPTPPSPPTPGNGTAPPPTPPSPPTPGNGTAPPPTPPSPPVICAGVDLMECDLGPVDGTGPPAPVTVVIEPRPPAGPLNLTGAGHAANLTIDVAVLAAPAGPPLDGSASSVVTFPSAETSVVASFATVTFPPSVEATHVPAGGRLALRVVADVPDDAQVQGALAYEGSGRVTLQRVVEVGAESGRVMFDMPVRILLEGQAGGRAFYIEGGADGGTITPIDLACAADDTGKVHSHLGGVGECQMDSTGGDKIIYTYHLTRFGTAQPERAAPLPAVHTCSVAIGMQNIGVSVRPGEYSAPVRQVVANSGSLRFAGVELAATPWIMNQSAAGPPAADPPPAPPAPAFGADAGRTASVNTATLVVSLPASATEVSTDAAGGAYRPLAAGMSVAGGLEGGAELPLWFRLNLSPHDGLRAGTLVQTVTYQAVCSAP